MPFSTTGKFAANTHGLACLLLCACSAHANSKPPAPGNLPDLPNASDAKPGHFDVDGNSAELGYATRQRTWGARLDEYRDLARSITLDYGTLLTNELGAGAALHRGSDYSDLWINGVYAPDHDFRLRVAGGQLRANENASSGADGVPNTVQQNSILFGARRSWRDGLVSGVGMSAYAVEANDAGATTSTPAPAFDDAPSEPQEPARGRQQGHVLNLSLQPTSQSKIDLSRERNRLAYYSAKGASGDHDVVASRVRFSQYFDNCTQLQGGYSSSDESSQIDLGLNHDRWHINVSRVQAVGSNGTAVNLGYTLPLGGSPNDAATCALQPDNGRSAASIIDTTVSRPAQFPQQPLTTGNMSDL
jgi:hypothetical protein